MEGGRAIAEALCGVINPSGRLPYSIPRGVGYQDSTYNRKPSAFAFGHYSGVPRAWSHTPLYPFGFGRSYTTFAYRDLEVPATLVTGAPITVAVTVANTGTRAGEDVVLLFVQDLYGSLTRPVRELKAWRRVALAPGATTRVTFDVPWEALAFLDRDMRRVVEPGDFAFSVGDLRTITTCLSR